MEFGIGRVIGDDRSVAGPDFAARQRLRSGRGVLDDQDRRGAGNRERCRSGIGGKRQELNARAILQRKRGIRDRDGVTSAPGLACPKQA